MDTATSNTLPSNNLIIPTANLTNYLLLYFVGSEIAM